MASSQEKGQIYTAMREWMEKTCVKFEPYSSQLARRLGHNQRIRLQANLTGCWSKVGMQGGKWGAPQIVSQAAFPLKSKKQAKLLSQ